ncbi:hypothetical protein Tco_0976242 [Tanacetum coccineum]|uniref:Uncharacterized protein n=1 Tax=Tanacetum coccineum TaxID=301880 RepID=A0ABQ5EGN1_9ASTR
MGLAAGSLFVTPTDAASVNDPDPLSYAEPQPFREQEIAQSSEIPTGNVATAKMQNLQSAGSSKSGKSTFVSSMVGSPKGIYRPGWGVTNSCRLDTPDACQDVVDHIVPPGLLKKARAQIARRDQRIQVREDKIKMLDQEIQSLWTVEEEVHGLRNRTKNLETLMEVEVTGEEKIKAAFKDFKKYEDDKVEQRCAEMDARLDALSIDFDEELYPHILTAIAGHRWVIGHGIRLAVLKCTESTELKKVFANVVSAGIAKGMSQGLKHRVEHEKAKLYLATIEAYDPEADAKFVTAVYAQKDFKIPSCRSTVEAEGCPHRFDYAILTLGESNGVPVSVPTIAPQGLAILLADAATQTETSEDEASPRLIRSKSLPPMYNLDWP